MKPIILASSSTARKSLLARLELPFESRSHYIVILQGPIEMEVSNGIKRCFNAGDIILAQDVSGKGHITRGLGEGSKQYLVIPLEAFSLGSTLDQMINTMAETDL